MSCYAYVFVYTYWCVITKDITDIVHKVENTFTINA